MKVTVDDPSGRIVYITHNPISERVWAVSICCESRTGLIALSKIGIDLIWDLGHTVAQVRFDIPESCELKYIGWVDNSPWLELWVIPEAQPDLWETIYDRKAPNPESPGTQKA